MGKKINLAIAGVGNCASSLLQGLEYYQQRDLEESAGLVHSEVGGYGVADVQVVAAFDIDRRKVGRPLQEAVFAKPNCTTIFQPDLPDYGVEVLMGPVLDGVAGHMQDYPEDQAFRAAEADPVDLARALRDSKVHVLACYLPVGLPCTPTPGPVWRLAWPWSTACPSSSPAIRSSRRSSASAACPSSAMTSRASSEPPSCTA